MAQKKRNQRQKISQLDYIKERGGLQDEAR